MVKNLQKHLFAIKLKTKQLARQLTPNFVMGCKRILISNKYFPTFNRQNVEFITMAIQEITETALLPKMAKNA